MEWYLNEDEHRFAECIQNQTRRQIANWSDGDVIDLGNEMQELTLAIIADALFDVDVRTASWDLSSAFTQILEHFERIGQTYIYVPAWIPTPANREYRRAVAELNDVVDEIIASHASGERHGDSVVALLLDQVADSEAWDREAIRDEIVTLLVAGHETTALALTFTGYLLGTHPGVTNDTRAAVDGLNDSSFLLGVRDCQMIEQVLKESLRLYPPAYSIFREPMSDIELGGYRIPAGSIIAVSQWATHRNEKLFEAPDEFRPSR